VRSAGRAAVEEVLAGAAPLAEMLWRRETEAGGFDTPERRAALEARLDTVTGAIGLDSVRKYYRQDFQARLRNLFAPAAPAPNRRGNGASWSSRGSQVGGMDRRPRFGERPRGYGGSSRGQGNPGLHFSQGPYVAASPYLATSPVHRGHLASVPRREALILLAVFNYPWLLHDHLEDLSGLEFRHGDTRKLRDAVIDIFAHEPAAEPAALRAEIARQGFEPLLLRVERAITTGSVWGARPDAAPDDVLATWKQLLALHRQWHSLLKELKDAEHALGQESTDANYSWLQDVKARLSDIEGTEALIEGFGVSSGRSRAS
jgi:DNA primase